MSLKKQVASILLLSSCAIFPFSFSYAEELGLTSADSPKSDVAEGKTNAGVSVEKGGRQVTPPISPKDPSVDLDTIDKDEGKQTNQEGPISIDYVSHFRFGGNHKIDQATMKIPLENKGTPFFQVTDITGDGTGWQLRGKLNEFKNDKGSTIKGAKISMSTGELITRNPSQTSDSSGFSIPKTVVFESGGNFVPLMTAKPDFGSGTWAVKFDDYKKSVIFEAPGKNIEANSTYKSGFVWQLVTVPQMD
ncbi:MAG: WxL domain-containing protein [Vagococcus sp.]|uniref:WxL domain-containing protein n=1 Tax=Vagococcus sp. TaxID=1933889 RepID=UPI002FC66290